jgi:hypothetical protein
MDPRIGKLNSGKYYAYVNGYNQEPVEGTLEQVEVALGIREVVSVAAPMKQEGKVYNVLLTFQYPAWDEKEGILYRDIYASSKSDAVAQARRMASDDGHAVGGGGKYWFKALDSEG